MRDIPPLDEATKSALKNQLKLCKDKVDSDRIRSVLSYDRDLSIKEIALVLHINEQTVLRYIKEYHSNNKLSSDPRGGRDSKLSPSQEDDLKRHLAIFTYLNTGQIISYIKEKYQVVYKVSGITKWLTRNGFVYKKPQSIPSKLDLIKQDVFITEYHQLKKSLGPSEEIFFIDASHPEYQSKPAFGWILKGQTKHLPTTAKQWRVNVLGGINLADQGLPGFHEVFSKQYETINADTFISFLNDLQSYSKANKIHIICDNGRAFKCEKVKEYLLKNEKVTIKYLPPYSPNLNPIERLWKILRENVQYNKYYKTFSDFCDAITEFLVDKSDELAIKIKQRINDNFQVFQPNIVLNSS